MMIAQRVAGLAIAGGLRHWVEEISGCAFMPGYVLESISSDPAAVASQSSSP